MTAAEAFGLNMLRFQNFRMRAARGYEREEMALRQAADALNRQAEALLRLDPHPVKRLFDSSARSMAENSRSWAYLWEKQLPMLPEEAALGREMLFVYLMAIVDGFVARWRIDMGLDREDKRWLEAAHPSTIRETCQALGIGLQFLPDFDATLEEMRARRNVLVHRGAIADLSYCETTGRADLLGSRLDVSERYLDEAQQIVMELVFTLISRSPKQPVAARLSGGTEADETAS